MTVEVVGETHPLSSSRSGNYTILNGLCQLAGRRPAGFEMLSHGVRGGYSGQGWRVIEAVDPEWVKTNGLPTAAASVEM